MSEKCKTCGASIEYSATNQSLKCPYCGAVNEISKPENQLPVQVEKIIPLAVKQEALDEQVYGYMARDNFAPDDLLDAATFTKREIFYAPAYLFSIDFDAGWTASFGYDRQEPYTAYRTVKDGNDSRQEAYTDYRTVTDWRPASGTEAGRFEVSAYAGKTLRDSPLAPWEIVSEAVACATPTTFNPSFMTGIQAESFTTSESKAYADSRGEIDRNIEESVKNNAQGDHQQDWRWNTSRLAHSSSTLYVPLCHAVFDYQGKEYHYWSDGVTGDAFRADKLPEDTGRKKSVSQSFVPFAAACVGLVLASFIWHFSGAGLASVAVFALYGFMRRNAIIGYSKTLRDAVAVQMQASASSATNLSKEEQARISKAYQRPVKPFLAKTDKDAMIIPLLSIVAFAAALLPACLK